MQTVIVVSHPQTGVIGVFATIMAWHNYAFQADLDADNDEYEVEELPVQK